MNEKLLAYYDEEILAELSKYGEVKKEEKDFGIVYTAGPSPEETALIVTDYDYRRVFGGFGQGQNAVEAMLDQGYPIELAFKVIADDYEAVMKKKGSYGA